MEAVRTGAAAPEVRAAHAHPRCLWTGASAGVGALSLAVVVLSPGWDAVFSPLTDLLQPLFTSDSSRWFMAGLWLAACGALLRLVRRA